MQVEHSLLFHAVVLCKFDFFIALIAAGARPELTNQRGTSVLWLIVQRNLLSWAEQSVSRMTDLKKSKFVNNSDINGASAIHLAVQKNMFAMVKWLFRAGASINEYSNRKWTCLHYAAKNGNRAILEFLLQNGGNQSAEALHQGGIRWLKVEDVAADNDTMLLLYKYK